MIDRSVMDLMRKPAQSRAVEVIGNALELEDILRETKKQIARFHMCIADETEKTIGNDLVAFTAFSKATDKLEKDVDNAFRKFIAARSLFAEDEKIRFVVPRCE